MRGWVDNNVWVAAARTRRSCTCTVLQIRISDTNRVIGAPVPKSLWLMAESEPEKRAWAEAVEVALVRGLGALACCAARARLCPRTTGVFPYNR